MTATYRPIRCPHGTDLDHYRSFYAIYEDGCRSATGAPIRFWCGPDEMSKPNGVSITEGEYLRDWQDAIDEAFHRWTAESKQREDCLDVEAAHAEALILNEGDELYDRAVKLNEIHDGLESIAEQYPAVAAAGSHEWWVADEDERDICGWCGGLAVLNDQSACASCAPNAAEHADHLGEVPWTDRIED